MFNVLLPQIVFTQLQSTRLLFWRHVAVWSWELLLLWQKKKKGKRWCNCLSSLYEILDLNVPFLFPHCQLLYAHMLSKRYVRLKLSWQSSRECRTEVWGTSTTMFHREHYCDLRETGRRCKKKKKRLGITTPFWKLGVVSIMFLITANILEFAFAVFEVIGESVCRGSEDRKCSRRHRMQCRGVRRCVM